jgi:hypothetical protein
MHSIMDPRFNLLPVSFRKILKGFKGGHPTSRGWLLLLGILSTLWFLVRVIPKPSRANYPCMQICAPFMSGLFVQMMALAGSVFSYQAYRRYYARVRYLPAFLFLAVAVMAWLVAFSVPSRLAHAINAPRSAQFYPPNDPVGIANGIFPGRVAWVWDSTSTNFSCANTVDSNGIIDAGDDEWFMLKNNDPADIDSMVSVCILTITGKNSLPAAWDTLFRYYNLNHGNGNTGYLPGQKVFVKLNCVSAVGDAGNHFNADLSRRDFCLVGTPLSTISNPFVVKSLLKQLVVYAGIPESMIYTGDPMQNIFKEDYVLWHDAFPAIHYLGNDLNHAGLEDLASLGRTPVAKGNGVITYSDHLTVMPDAGTDTLYDVFDIANYIINLPAMKAHACAGISLAAKNHWGSITRYNAWHLHDGIVAKNNDEPYRTEYGMYRAQDDMLEHKMLGGKTMLILVDGLFCGDEANCTPQHWTSLPFSNNWASSLFISQDPIAIESVCFDFLRTEYNGQNGKVNRPNMGAVDDYLHQAADSSLWPDGIIYDPDNDGILYASLGVHEHWNDSVKKEYTRNLGTGDGIELVCIKDVMTAVPGPQPVSPVFRFAPNPVTNYLEITGNTREELTVSLLSLNGSLLSTAGHSGGSPVILDLRELTCGIYLVRITCSSGVFVKKILKVRD